MTKNPVGIERYLAAKALATMNSKITSLCVFIVRKTNLRL